MDDHLIPVLVGIAFNTLAVLTVFVIAWRSRGQTNKNRDKTDELVEEWRKFQERQDS